MIRNLTNRLLHRLGLLVYLDDNRRARKEREQEEQDPYYYLLKEDRGLSIAPAGKFVVWGRTDIESFEFERERRVVGTFFKAVCDAWRESDAFTCMVVFDDRGRLCFRAGTTGLPF